MGAVVFPVVDERGGAVCCCCGGGGGGTGAGVVAGTLDVPPVADFNLAIPA